MTLHSKIGASSCERFWNCPGSLTVYGDLPSSKSTFYSAQGTVAHSIGESYLRQNRVVDDAMLGSIVKEEGFNIEVTAEMLEAVDVYVGYVQSRLGELNLDPKRLGVEVGLSLAHLDPDAFGTGDASIYVPFEGLEIIDYKHGQGIPVDIKDNKQTKYYLLGSFYALPEVEREFLEWFKATIVQPRCPHDGGVIRSATYSLDELMEFEQGLRDAFRRIRSGDETLSAGAHCKYCPARPICSEARADVGRTAKIDFAKVEADIPIDPKGLNGAEIANLLRHLPVIRGWCDDVESQAYRMAERGVDLPGYDLVPRRSNRKWKDEKQVVEEFEFELGQGLYGPRKLLSPAQLEKKLPKAERNRIAAFCEKPEEGNTLAKVEGSRVKRLPTAITDFADLDF